MTAREGQVSVITGGSAGLGLAIAAALAEAGSTVVLAGRSAERCEQAARSVTARTGRPALGHACDMRRWAQPQELTGAALLLTDPQSTFLTGAVLPVDGGWTSH